jgi:hypothetical protein
MATQRTEALLVKFTPGEKMRLGFLADQAGISMADMLRYLISLRIIDTGLSDHPQIIESIEADRSN